MYLLPFLVGFIGFLALFGLAFGHFGHGHGDSHSPGDGHGHSHGGPHGVGHLGDGHLGDGHHGESHHVGTHGGGEHPAGMPPVVRLAHLVRSGSRWFALSPTAIFTLALGFGATGLLLEKRLPAPYVLPIAVAGGVGFHLLLSHVLVSALMRFAGKPSDGLEGAVAKAGEAATSFDDTGRGLVRLTLDDETVQVLAVLDPGEVARGVRVRRGDPLLVTGVDARRNLCHVTRELAS